MGLSFYYHGEFNIQSSLSSMIEEVKDICEVQKWSYHIFETEFPATSVEYPNHDNNIYGICFTPPESETVFLCFLSNKKMSSPINLHLYGKQADENEKEYLYKNFTKTQFAGHKIHMLIMHILKYLKPKYFHELNVMDEGKYWETGDEHLLEQTFSKYTFLIDTVAHAIESVPVNKGESIGEYFQRILKKIQENKTE